MDILDLNFFLSINRKISFCRCWHAQQALEASEIAKMTPVSITNMGELTEAQKKTIENSSRDKTLQLYSLPGGNICVPLLSEETAESSIPFTHVMNDKVLKHNNRPCKE